VAPIRPNSWFKNLRGARSPMVWCLFRCVNRSYRTMTGLSCPSSCSRTWIWVAAGKYVGSPAWRPSGSKPSRCSSNSKIADLSCTSTATSRACCVRGTAGGEVMHAAVNRHPSRTPGAPPPTQLCDDRLHAAVMEGRCVKTLNVQPSASRADFHLLVMFTPFMILG
jgi:hypothetical protein